jgi:KipI family sensor histidine kinase inhibitor
MKPRFLPLGDAALLIELGDQIDSAVNRRVHTVDAWLRSRAPHGIVEFVPAYASLLVHYDPLVLSFAEVHRWAEEQLSSAKEIAGAEPRMIQVPVSYGGVDGPDLEAVAALHGLTAEEVARIHAGRDYTVYMMGFTPGFPYLGTLDESISAPRLPSPRMRVPAGSVGITGLQTGIYPIESPGGWQLIGRTSMRLFDLQSDDPFAFAPGDTVRFVIEALNA